MKKLLFSLLLFFSIVTVESQINMPRYNDNFSALKKDTIKTGLDELKEIRIGAKTFVSFGGEIREQYQYFDNMNFGDVPQGSKATVGQLWHRVMVHSNIEIGAKARFFLQLNSTFRFFNPNPVTPEIDENQLSLHQAFIDYDFSKKWKIRAGRQEMIYGKSRLITLREGPNTRQTFDAAIIKYSSKKTKIDLFAATPVTSKQYVFDDTSFDDALFGVYGTTQADLKKLLLDYYFINFKSDRRKYNYVAGEENRQIFGLRFFSKNTRLNYELESTYQTGRFNDLIIRAYAICGDLNYLLAANWKLILGVAGNYISGDKESKDGKLNSYNFLFSKPQYGLAAPIGSSNIKNINPYIKISPNKKLFLLASVYFMERLSIADGTYSPGAVQIRPRPAALISTDKKIGTQYSLETSYTINKNFSIAMDGAFFNAGDYIKETGVGKNITYLSFTVSGKF